MRELAGEIAQAYPRKTVTLVASNPTLFSNDPAKLGTSLRTKLQADVDAIPTKDIAMRTIC